MSSISPLSLNPLCTRSSTRWSHAEISSVKSLLNREFPKKSSRLLKITAKRLWRMLMSRVRPSNSTKSNGWLKSGPRLKPMKNLTTEMIPVLIWQPSTRLVRRSPSSLLMVESSTTRLLRSSRLVRSLLKKERVSIGVLQKHLLSQLWLTKVTKFVSPVRMLKEVPSLIVTLTSSTKIMTVIIALSTRSHSRQEMRAATLSHPALTFPNTLFSVSNMVMPRLFPTPWPFGKLNSVTSQTEVKSSLINLSHLVRPSGTSTTVLWCSYPTVSMEMVLSIQVAVLSVSCSSVTHPIPPRWSQSVTFTKSAICRLLTQPPLPNTSTFSVDSS